MQLDLVGYALGIGSTDNRSANGPRAIAQWLSLNDIMPVTWHGMHGVEGITVGQMQALPYITSACQSLAETTHKLATQKKRWVSVGGDHSGAIGTWSGVSAATQGPIGLIWFDAHLDAHTPESSHTKNIHGMPIACLLGHGPDELTQIQGPQAKLKPEHIHYIGIRDYETEEMDFVLSQGINFYTNQDVKEQGFHKILMSVCQKLEQSTVGFGLSFDVDGLDPEDAPGVATAVADGVRWSEVKPAIETVLSHPSLLGLEIVEFNPDLDVDNKTLDIIISLLKLYQR